MIQSIVICVRRTKLGALLELAGILLSNCGLRRRRGLELVKPFRGAMSMWSPFTVQIETNSHGNELISPAQDALFQVHDRVVAATDESPMNGASDESLQVTVRLLMPSDQIGCVIGKDNWRNHCSEEALFQVASCLHDNPSRSQHSLLITMNIYQSGNAFNNRDAAGPLVMKEFSLRMVCPTENIGALIGKGGVIIKHIRWESAAFIVVDSSSADGDDCVISVLSKETFEDPSRTMDAIMRLQPQCSVKIENDSGGAIIREIRCTTKTSIHMFSDENVPKVALEDDEMVQIIGEPNAARNALLLVMRRLRAYYLRVREAFQHFPELLRTFQHQKRQLMVQHMQIVRMECMIWDIQPTLAASTLKPCLQLTVIEDVKMHRMSVEVVTEGILDI